MSETISRETDCSTINIALQIQQKRMGRRQLVLHGGTLCSRCYEQPPRPGQRYCAPCHAADERARRVKRSEELKRLRALEQSLSNGKENGQSDSAADG